MDEVCYNAIMAAHGKKGQYREVRKYFEMMCEQKLCPNAKHFTTLVSACSLKQKTDVADLVFDEMLASKISPTTESYNALIQVHRFNIAKCRMLFEKLVADHR